MKKLLKVLVPVLALALLANAGLAAPSGSLSTAGSTTVLPLAQIWAQAFMEKYPETSVSVSGGGSGTGISMLLNGTVDVANASRQAKKKEIDTAKTRNAKLVETKLAKDGIALIVHPSNNVKNLTMAQLAAVYGGKALNWKQVGGNNSRQLVVIGRDTSSGTYGFFQQAVLGGKAYRKDMLSMASNAAVAQAVAQSKDAIGYVGMAYAEHFEKEGKVRTISLSRAKGEPGQKPTVDAVKAGTYPLFRYLYSYTLGSPSGLAGEYLRWCTGPEGQAMVDDAGYVALK